MSDLYDRLEETCAAIRARVGAERAQPRVALVLGSGLGGFADRLSRAVAIDYAELPHVPSSSVAGHAGRLVVGEMGGVVCAAMQGRLHYYEGHDIDTVVFPIRTMLRLGARILIATNAAGGVNPDFAPGALMVIRDHLNLFPSHPLRGPNDDRLGPRFPDMSDAYSARLRDLAHQVAGELGAPLEEGVYAGLSGPSYETPAEVRMLARLGADAVGMSTVPEVIAAHHMGAEVLGISCITNAAAGVGAEPLSHQDVTAVAARVRDRFEALLSGILSALGQEAQP